MGSTRSIFSLILVIVVAMLVAPFASADQGPAHKKRLPRPIKLGTSGGNVKDFTTQFCCSGTLGAVVKDASGKQYILSNNHVLAKSNTAILGDPISQPGNIDAQCAPLSTDTVANLSKFVRTQFGANTNNKVDAAVAAVIPGKVSSTGFIMDVNIPGQPVEAVLGMKVKKSGRTTGLRRGIIETINLTVRVQIPSKCGSSTVKIARYINQIGIDDAPGGTPPPFIAAGDSGSLLVKDIGTCPGTVGLLFAGDDSGFAVANKIQNVLTALGGMKMVGCAAVAAQKADELTVLHPDVMRAAAIQGRNEDRLFALPGVIGVGIGFAKPGSRELALVVYTARGTQAADARFLLPASVENLPVRKVVTGVFTAF